MYSLTGLGVYVGVCMYIRTHTHTLHVDYSDVSPGVGTRHLEGPKNLEWMKIAFIIAHKKIM